MPMNFFEGPISATLLGAIFELYSETEMRDFIITSVEWDDESKTSGERYILQMKRVERVGCLSENI